MPQPSRPAAFHSDWIRSEVTRLHGLLSVIITLLVLAVSAVAQVPDLTAGGVPTSTKNFNLGPTGMHGWLYHTTTESDDSRQILVNTVDVGSPADGILLAGDVILGVDGTGANPVNFTSNARKAMGYAIADAEASTPPELKLLRWRAGTTTTVTLPLQYLGAYSATAPYNCPKSAAILEQGLAYVDANLDAGLFSFGSLALMAANDPANPANAARQARARSEVLSVLPSQAQMDDMLAGVVSTESKITWNYGHKLTLLAEYYLQTGDPQVFPAIEAISVAIANGQGVLGTMGHRLTNPDQNGNLNGPYNVGYGAVNSAAMPCFFGMVLAQKCGVTRPELQPAIDRGSRFFASYSGYGSHPYGEHDPYRFFHEGNGKSGLAALAFSLQPNRVVEGKFYAQMATAATSERIYGHNGPWSNYIWSPLGAATGGEEAAVSHFSRISWALDMSRRWDGGFEYHTLHQGGNGGTLQAWEINNAYMYVPALLTYALPLRQLEITGRSHDPARDLSSAEVSIAALADDYDAASRTTTELVADLGMFSPKVQDLAAVELGTRTAEHATLVPQLIAIANDVNAGEQRIGACFALGKIGDGSAVADLVALLEDANDEVSYAAAIGLCDMPQADRMVHLNAMLVAAANKARPLYPLDPVNPLQFATAEIGRLLFGTQGVVTLNGLAGIDRNLLFPAMAAVASHPMGSARSKLTTIYPLLTQADVEAASGTIIDSTKESAPGDKMFAWQVRQAGLDALQAFNYAEGVPLAKIMAEDKTLVTDVRVSAFDTLKLYAGSSTLVNPDPGIVDFCEYMVFNDSGVAADALQVLAAITADTIPVAPTPLKTIQTITSDVSSLTLPNKYTQLHVVGADLAQGDTIYTWRKVHGAGQVTFSPNKTLAAKDTTVVFDGIPGKYLFEVIMSDSRGLTEAVETIAMTLYESGGTLPPNSPPTANAQALTITQNTTTPIWLGGSDPEGYGISYAVTVPPTNGKLTGSAPYLTYTSEFGYTGPDSVTFEVTDSEGQTGSATVSITVTTGAIVQAAIYEPFDYPVGGLNGKSGSAEVGLSGTWAAHAETILTAGSLDYGSLSGTGNKYEAPYAGTNRWGGTRAISTSALAANGLLDDGATLWFSMEVGYAPGASLANARLGVALANSGFSTNNYKYWIQNEGAQLGSGIGLSLGKFYFLGGLVVATQFQDLSKGDGTVGNIIGSWEGTGTQYSSPGNGLIVGRITWSEDPELPDTIELFQPQTDLGLPAAPISVLSAVLDQSTFDTLTFAKGDLVTLDEIRFGPNYHSVLVGNQPLTADLTVPTPDPLNFHTPPTALNGTSIFMEAAPAYDSSGVEYYFTCTAGGGNDSGWQSSTSYTDTGMTPGVQYSYTVTARDLSTAQNTTAPSAAASVTLPTSTNVPTVVGMYQNSAVGVIETFSFVVGTVSTAIDPLVPVGQVISQTPSGESSAAVGSTVDLVVSSGGNTTAPTIASVDFVDDQGGAAVGINSMVTFALTFSKDLNGSSLGTSDFVNVGTSTTSITNVAEVSPGVVVLEATPSNIGTLQLAIAAGAVITDLDGNALDTSSAIADDTTITVNSIAGSNAVVYEPFDYPVGALNGQSGSSEVGLDGTWTADATSTLTAGSLSYGILNTLGNKFETSTGSVNRFGGARAINNIALLDNGLLADGATLWFSMEVGYVTGASNARLAVALGNNGFNNGYYNFWINDDGPMLGSGVGITLGNIGGAGRVVATQFQAGSQGDGISGNITGTWEGNGVTYQAGQHGLIVGRITWSADPAQPDTIELFQPASELAMPAAPISVLNAVLDQSTFDTLTFCRSDLVTLDEIRFGANYEGVTGMAPSNSAPTWTSNPISEVDATEDTAYTATLADNASDLNTGDTLTYAKVSGPAWLTVASNGDLSGTPTNSDVGANVITVSVTDGIIVTPVQATLNIAVINTNDAPVFAVDPINGSDATEDTVYAGTVAGSASDVDAGASLTYAKVSGPSWLVVAANGDLSGTPTNSDVGANVITVSVTDSIIVTPVQATLNIAVINTNDAPVFAANPINGSDATEDAIYAGTIAGSATDVDAGASLTYAKVSGPAWLSVAPNGTLSGTPTNSDVGANVITVSVTDSIIVTPVQATLNIAVINTNDAPVFTVDPINGSDATEDTVYAGTCAGSASDVDAGASLTYAKVSGPSWLVVAANGDLSGTPANSDVGANVITVSVTDGIIVTPVQATLNIAVINTNDAPVFTVDPINGSDATEDAIYAGTLAGSATDDDAGASLTYAKVSGPAWLSVAPNGDLSGTPTNSDVGANVITVSVTDSIIVTPVNATLNIAVKAGGIPTAVVYESFDYPVGGLNGQSGGSEVGLNGAWAADASTTLTAGSLSYGGLSTAGNKMVPPVGGSNRWGGTRAISASALAANGLLDDGATLWFSMEVGYATGANRTNARLAVALANSGFNAGYYNFWLDDEVPQLGSGVGITLGNISGAGRVVATQFQDSAKGDGISGNITGTWESAGVAYNDQEHGLIIGRITWSNDPLLADTIELFQPATDLVLPAAPISVLNAVLDQSTFDTLTFCRGDVVTLDEIRFGASYDSVIGAVAGNSDPVWSGNPVNGIDATEDATYASTLADDAFDIDAADTLTYAKVSGPAWLVVAANGTLSGTSTNADVGVNVFTVSVTDNIIATPVETTLNITVINTNDAPVFAADPINGSDATEDAVYAGTLAGSAADIDPGASLTYAKVSGPAWLVVAANGDLSGTPANSDVGVNVITVSVTDGIIVTPVQATLNIAVINTNDAPVFAVDPINGSDATEDTVYAGTIAGSAADIDPGASLIYAKVSGPAWLSVAPNGTLSGTPTNSDVGANVITVSVTDSIIVTPVQATLNIAVINTNDAPVFAVDPINGSGATEDAVYAGTLAGSATDVDAGASLTYAKVSGPAWLSVAPNGTLSGTPISVNVGINAFTVSVTDSIIATPVQATLNITVTAAPPSPKLVRTTVNAVSNTSWSTVSLGRTYTSPVIIATPIYPTGVTIPVVTRITNITPTGFDIKLDRADGLTGAVNFNVSVVAVDEGVYTQAVDGVTMEAVKFTSTLTAYGAANWVAEVRGYQNSYTNPVVLGQVMSANDAKWSVFWSMGLTRTDPVDAANFNVCKHVGQDSVTVRANETIGYIVIEAGSGMIDGVAYEAGVGADIVQCFGDSSTPYSYSLTGSLSSVSTAAISQTGMDGNDGSWAVLSGSPAVTTTSLSLHLAEDSLKDSRQKHTSEQVGYIVFE